MKVYELTCLISPELSEEEAKNFQEKIVSFIFQEGGILVERKLPFKKKLAYAVKKQTQAYLAVINFQLLPEKLTDLEKKVKAEDKILRYIFLIKLRPKEIRVTLKRFAPEKVILRPKEKKAKVELEEIEKKLEEILE